MKISSSSRLALVAVVAAAILQLVACSGETTKDVTGAVVGKAIEVGKGTATGIAEGVEQGRKNAESADGAVIISNADELAKVGGVTLGEVAPAGEQAKVAILVENKGDKPARVTNIAVIALDTDGVVIPTTPSSSEVTVPPHAKSRYEFTAAAKAEKVKTVRFYGKDVPR
jgi:hypothetical protein